jgi:predicted glycoside hydrolase/deacetylase ChbG (UPF0249 family)
VSSLVSERCYFLARPAELLTRILARKLRLAEIESEWRAQIQEVRGAGIEVTHLDGHKHVHMLPPLFPIVLRLAREYSIPGVRLAVERPVSLARLLRRNGGAAGQLMKQYLWGRALATMAIGFRETLKRAGLNSPMYFYGMTQTGFLDGAELEAILWNLPEGASELMCHPGYVDGALEQTRTRLLAERERELDALTREETRKLVAALGIQLIDYRDLAAAP